MAYPTMETVNVTSSSGLVNSLQYLNDVTGGWFWGLILLGLYVILLVNIYRMNEDVPATLGTAGWAIFAVSLLFWVSGLLSGWFFAISIALALIGVIALLTQ